MMQPLPGKPTSTFDTETHTWTTGNFIKAVDALYAYYKEPVGGVCCSGPGVDQGIRCSRQQPLRRHVCNAEHTAYTADSSENAKGFLTSPEHGRHLLQRSRERRRGDYHRFPSGHSQDGVLLEHRSAAPTPITTMPSSPTTARRSFSASFPSETGESKLQGRAGLQRVR